MELLHHLPSKTPGCFLWHPRSTSKSNSSLNSIKSISMLSLPRSDCHFLNPEYCQPLLKVWPPSPTPLLPAPQIQLPWSSVFVIPSYKGSLTPKMYRTTIQVIKRKLIKAFILPDWWTHQDLSHLRALVPSLPSAWKPRPRYPHVWFPYFLQVFTQNVPS